MRVVFSAIIPLLVKSRCPLWVQRDKSRFIADRYRSRIHRTGAARIVECQGRPIGEMMVPAIFEHLPGRDPSTQLRPWSFTWTVDRAPDGYPIEIDVLG